MSNMTRQRGRPVGTQINDHPTLTKMADLIAVNPALRPTTAIHRVLAAPGPSIIRRLQVKWKDHGAGLLVDAKARLDARKALVPVADPVYLLEIERKIAEAQCRFLEVMNSPAMLATHEALRRHHESPAMQVLREFHNRQDMKAMREMQDSPVVRAMRELQDRPEMHAIREAQSGPLMQAMRAAETLSIEKWRTYSASVGRPGSSRG